MGTQEQLADRIESGIACMEALKKYVEEFGIDIDAKVIKAEAGEAILRMQGKYGE